MKKLLLITAVTIASVSAHASRARLNALQNAQHLDDIQRVYIDQPERIVNYEAATVEFGGDAAATPSAEGGFIRRMGDSAFTMYLGRPSQTFADFVGGFTGNFTGSAAADEIGANLAAGHAQQNSLLLGYGSKMGDISWGATVLHIGSDLRSTQTFGVATGAGTGYSVSRLEQSITGVHLGATNGVWDVQLRQGLGGEIKSTVAAVGTTFGTATGIAANDVLTVESTQSTRLRAGYKMDTMYVYGNYAMGAGEIKSSTDGKLVDLENSEIRLGVLNSNKKDGVEFFYGAEVVSTTVDNDGSVNPGKTETTNVPVYVGVEAEATSWMVLRGGLSQSINLLSSTKETGTSEGDIADNTTASLGAGFKWGKAMIDAVVSTGNTGNFGFDGGNGDILGQASLTYFF